MRTFVADPKTWIAFGALLISIASLMYGFINNRRQNARWLSLNRPRFRLINPRLHVWGTVDKTSCRDGTIDYDLLVYNQDDGSSERLDAHGQLVFHNPATGQRHHGHGAIFTVPEAEAEARRLNLSSYLIVQYLRFVLPFRNTGKMAANKVSGAVSIVGGSGERIPVSEIHSEYAAPDEDFFVLAPMAIPLEADAPSELVFEAVLKYQDDEAARYEERILRRWTRQDNGWHLVSTTGIAK